MSAVTSHLKRPTRIDGLDEMTRGGLPVSGVTLLAGGTGTGKTVLSLQLMARAAEAGDGAVLVSFEESEVRLRRSAASFTWAGLLDDADLVRIIDARPPAITAGAGTFGLEALTATLQAVVEGLPRPWVILDGIDHLLVHQPAGLDAAAQLLELDAWSERAQVPVILTAKTGTTVSSNEGLLSTYEFLLPTSIRLSTSLIGQRLARRLRIVKYRGSGHTTDDVPMVINDDGVHLPYGAWLKSPEPGVEPSVDRQRVSTGIPRLDRVLGGGLYRGSTTLISGAPGTAKTTLSSSIAEAAAERGERALFITFDEASERVVLNAASVGIDLSTHVRSGRIRIVSSSAWTSLAEEHFLAIHRLLEDDRPDVLVIDPISALLKQEEDWAAFLSIDRILGVARDRGVMTVLTSLTTGEGVDEGTRSRASTLADTWISLTYNINRGERNRALSVVKSRGTGHSNQVRELLMSPEGIDLVEGYALGSDVLMGTARMNEEHLLEQRARAEQERHEEKLRSLEAALVDLRSRRDDVDREEKRLVAALERARADAKELSSLTARERDAIRDHRRQTDVLDDAPRRDRPPHARTRRRDTQRDGGSDDT